MNRLQRVTCATMGLVFVTGCGDVLNPGPRPTSVSVSPVVPTLVDGDTLRLTAKVFDEAGNVIPNAKVTWRSSADSMLTVDASGLATAHLKLGWDESLLRATVTASSGNVHGETTVSITARPMRVAFASHEAAMIIGDTVTPSASVTNSVGASTSAGVTFSSSSPEVSVVPSGRIYALRAGVAVIMAAYGTLRDSMIVTISHPSIASITFAKDSMASFIDEQQLLDLAVRDVRGKVVPNGEVSIASVDTSIAYADCCGFIYGRRLGKTRVVASWGAYADTVQVSVVPDFRQIASGTVHRCGVSGKGTLYCWGGDGAGELGVPPPGACPTSSNRCSPVPLAVPGGERFVSVTAGQMHTCALTPGGEAYCWGSNFSGELGNGLTASGPTAVPVSTSLRFTSLNAGMYHTCGIATSGAAYCWGRDASGQLGLGATAAQRCSDLACSTTPAPVAGSLTFIELSAMVDFTCGLTTAHTIYCWGLSVGVDLISRTPVPQANGATFAALVASKDAICGRANDGALTCWRYNSNGEFGNGTAENLLVTAPQSAASGRRFASYSGGYGTICALDSDGAPWCWGVGYGMSPTNLAGSLHFARLAPSAASTSACALTDTGQAYCWGAGGYGQLGDGSWSDSSAPVRVHPYP